MIHFRFSKDDPDKSKWLLEQHRCTKGKLIVTSASDVVKLQRLGISAVSYKVNFKAYNIFLLNDFFQQNYISLKDVIDLDKRGCDVYMTGTPEESVPKFFLDYIVQNYPETLV